MMLNLTDYYNLWKKNLGMPLHLIPCYYQYLQREVYFIDYRDLFCCPSNGNPTFDRIKIKNKFCVYIPNLIADPNGTHTIIDKSGKVYLVVDYDYPFNRNELLKTRKIKYILIGEGAHPSSNTYFYNVLHSKYTPYFGQPIRALGVVSGNKIDELLSLANSGVMFLDLLPFSYNYSETMSQKTSLRTAFCTKCLISLFWNDSKNNYSIYNRLLGMAACFSVNWDLSLMAPCQLSEHLIKLGPINNLPSGLHTMNFQHQNPNNLRCSMGKKYLKITINSSNQGPSACLIRLSFGLSC